MAFENNSTESDPGKLIKTMNPRLHDGDYVFATVGKDFPYQELSPVLVFQEIEGTTLILCRELAETRGLPYEFASRMITLNVYSALDAVGFLARITQALAERKISVNTVSAFYHDHLFVPVDRVADALGVLDQLVDNAEKAT